MKAYKLEDTQQSINPILSLAFFLSLIFQIMGKFGHHFDHQGHNKSQRSGANKVKKNPLKVTYISSPMKVKASNASEFRAIVQELTGKNSEVKDHNSDDVVFPHAEEAKVFSHNHESDHRLKRTSTYADEFLSHLSSSHDQFQIDHESFLWRDVPAAAESSFGFQSPNNLSFYDCIFTAT
ncbi:hypothetical protein WN944_027274 [Citrus x changshan-huyou]